MMRAIARFFLTLEYRFCCVDAYLAAQRGDIDEVRYQMAAAHRAQADLRWRMMK